MDLIRLLSARLKCDCDIITTWAIVVFGEEDEWFWFWEDEDEEDGED